jgi:hypothetical protein
MFVFSLLEIESSSEIAPQQPGIACPENSEINKGITYYDTKKCSNLLGATVMVALNL